ncbi:hypothetical protein AVDCRST_MAG81-4676 [uncultured Synechococcales cyanobacterium]|uniref:Amidase domain-containing protein n=1 Tax=uncultured Synechococcales cyanobacterium TaxID=1936017 RepID=A0A6J4VVM8_9CYAN|nr:hypothetical protein AVDCRST_MAG81-4676 [uncultured Synechococcales cyanobacterium]
MPVATLVDVVASNDVDLANRSAYGQNALKELQLTDSASTTYTTLLKTNQTTAQTVLNQFFTKAGIDVLIASTQAYATAGYSALTLPLGLSKSGEPQGAILIDKYLDEPKLLALGYAIAQATRARKPPNLDATLATFTKLSQAAPKSP